MSFPLISGAIDIHVHAAPSLFERWGDAWELAEECANAGMGGFVLKSHRMSTVETAAVLAPRFPQLQIFGGLALNGFVGGINPIAVDAQLKLGARIIWLPTLHAAHHEERCGCLGGFSFQTVKHGSASHGLASEETGPEVTPLRVINEKGALTPQTREVIHLMHQKPAALASGHVSFEEIRAIQRYVKAEKLDIRLLVNHVQFTTPKLDVVQLRELTNDWTWFETVQLCIAPMVACATPTEIAAQIGAVPEARWIVATDSGQKKNKRCPEALSDFASALLGAGVARERLARMMRAEPLAAIGAA